jgi:hypothetical protein
MGADMLLAMVRAPYAADPTTRLTVDQIITATTRRLDALNWTELADALDTFDDPGQTIRERAEEAVAELLGRSRDTAWITIDGKNYIVTGGLSTGDSPTDAYEHVELLDELGIWEEAITPGELIP